MPGCRKVTASWDSHLRESQADRFNEIPIRGPDLDVAWPQDQTFVAWVNTLLPRDGGPGRNKEFKWDRCAECAL